MTDRDGQFWPESNEEQLDQLARAASHFTEPTRDARLEEDLRTVYTEYTRAGERVWARLAERLAERDESPNNVRLMASEGLQAERFEHLQVERGQFATQPAPQPKSPRKLGTGSFFTLVAAVLVAAMLVGSAFFVFTSMHLLVGGTIGASSTPIATPMPVLNLPCPQTAFTPQAASAADFNTLCQEHKIQVIQQSFKLHGNQTLTLVAGYADSSSVTLWFHVAKNPSVTLDGSASSPQQANGPGNFSIGAGGCSFGGPSGQLDCLEFFDLHNVPANLRILDLDIRESVGNGSQDQAPVIAVFRFSLFFYADLKTR